MAKSLSYAFYFTLLWLASISVASAQILNLDTQNDDVNIFDHMVIAGDRTFNLDDVVSREKTTASAKQNAAVDRIMPETTADGDWLFVQVKNSTNRGMNRVLDTEHFADHDYAVYLEQGGRVELILDARSPAQDIKDRIRPELVLASNPINIAPREAVNLWAQFKNGSIAGSVPIYLRSESILTQHRSKNSSANSLFYGVSVTLLAFLVLFSFLLQSRPARYYSLFLLATIALNMQQDGYFSLVFYAGNTNFNIVTRLFWQFVMILSYQLFMISFLDLRNRFPRFFALICLYLFVVLVVLALYPFLGTTNFYNHAINAVALAFALISIGSAILAYRSNLYGSTFFILGIAIFIGYLTFSVANNFLWQYNYDFSVVLTVKIAQLLDASVFAAAMLRQTFGLRKQRDLALKSELATAQENLEIAQSLLAANKDRDRAKALAERHQNKLADVSHDMRQPLTSLQLALEQADKSSPELKKKLEAGLDYLDSVLGNTLEEIHPSEHQQVDTETQAEHVPLQLVFDNLDRMFGSEAKEKGLKLDFDKTALIVEANAVELIRMLSNLVSNAIKYTDSGGVKVSCPNPGESVSIAVEDTGYGMAEKDLAHKMKRYQRGTSDVDGKGLGLNIVSNIAKNSGLTFQAESEIGKGSVFIIGEIPKAGG